MLIREHILIERMHVDEVINVVLQRSPEIVARRAHRAAESVTHQVLRRSLQEASPLRDILKMAYVPIAQR